MFFSLRRWEVFHGSSNRFRRMLAVLLVVIFLLKIVAKIATQAMVLAMWSKKIQQLLQSHLRNCWNTSKCCTVEGKLAEFLTETMDHLLGKNRPSIVSQTFWSDSQWGQIFFCWNSVKT